MGDENERKYRALDEAWGIDTKPSRLMKSSRLRRVLKALRLIR